MSQVTKEDIENAIKHMHPIDAANAGRIGDAFIAGMEHVIKAAGGQTSLTTYEACWNALVEAGCITGPVIAEPN